MRREQTLSAEQDTTAEPEPVLTAYLDLQLCNLLLLPRNPLGYSAIHMPKISGPQACFQDVGIPGGKGRDYSGISFLPVKANGPL